MVQFKLVWAQTERDLLSCLLHIQIGMVLLTYKCVHTKIFTHFYFWARLSKSFIFPTRFLVKKACKILLCNKKVLLILHNKDTLKSREYTPILLNLKVNSMGRNVAQSNAKLLMTFPRKQFHFKFAVSVEDAYMAGYVLHSSLGHGLLRLSEICHEFSVSLVEMGKFEERQNWETNKLSKIMLFIFW